MRMVCSKRISTRLSAVVRSKEVWAFALPLLFVFSAFALSAPAPDYWHGSDYYSVEFDGEGDAFVLATLDLEGISDKEVSTIALEIPYDVVQVYKVAQGSYGSAGFVDFNSTGVGGSTILSVSLKDRLEKNGRTTLAVVYQVPHAAEKGWRGYSFRFETMKDRSALSRYVGANIAVPEGMQLKGRGDANVKYRPSLMVQASSAKAMLAEVMPGYGYAPPAAHSARNVDPGESFVLTGLYGESWFLLYLPEIMVATAGFFFVFLFAKAFSVVGRLRGLFSAPSQRQVRFAGDFSLARSLVLGGFSAVSFTLVYFISDAISRSMHGGIIPFLLMVLTWFLIILSFGVPAYHGFRSSWKEGVATFAFALAFSIVLLFLFSSPDYTIYYQNEFV